MAVPTDPLEPTRDVIEEAAAWQAQMADEDCSVAERAAFEQWIGAHPARRVAYDRMTAIAGRAEGAGFDRKAKPRVVSGQLRAIAPAILLLVSFGAFAWWSNGQPEVRARLAGERTAIGQQQHLVAPSGDRLTLDSESAADVDDREREVRLWRGRLMAEVRPGQATSFVVRTRQGTARALGTRYSVRVDGDATIISVIESRVEACASRGNRTCLLLVAGQSARLDDQGAHRDADVDSVEANAWADGILIADDRPLASVIDELNRYRKNKIHYERSDLEGLNLSGSFPLTDTDRALRSIKAALPVTIEVTPEGVYIARR